MQWRQGRARGGVWHRARKEPPTFKATEKFIMINSEQSALVHHERWFTKSRFVSGAGHRTGVSTTRRYRTEIVSNVVVGVNAVEILGLKHVLHVSRACGHTSSQVAR